MTPLQRLFESRRPMVARLFDYLAPPTASHSYAAQAQAGAQFTQGRAAGRQALMALVLQHLPASAKSLQWLELGCCDGLNLMALKALGVDKVKGIELNASFIAAGRAYAPAFFAQTPVLNTSIEDYFAQSEPTDVTFTCNVLQHLSPSHNAVFEQIAARTRRYIVTVESELQCNAIHYPRNHGRVFEKLGFKEIHATLLVKEAEHLPSGLAWNHLRILEKIDHGA
jgi:2-polyprenyl-3-methyl-5-hydroxy-6-metoxy-1,4-benzoquinol methylase